MCANQKSYIKSLTLPAMEAMFEEMNQPKYRAIQLFEGIYCQRFTNFNSFTTLKEDMRANLDSRFSFRVFKSHISEQSSDGTQKFALTLYDDNIIEAVLIPENSVNPSKTRLTLCLSSQAGCGFNCAFCHTGTMGLRRNLDTAEIVEQMLYLENISTQKITNVVFMGMGEPFANFQNVIDSIQILTNPKAKLLSPHRITVSTVGVVPKIYELADLSLGVKLALSLHATTDETRKKIIPSAAQWSLKQILESLDYFYKKTGIPITYEYILFDGLNDSPEDALQLSKIAKRVNSKVNIISYHHLNNSGNKIELLPANQSKIESFIARLKEYDVHAFLRKSSGADIQAACGQLALSGISTNKFEL